jgi:hypothetical protein
LTPWQAKREFHEQSSIAKLTRKENGGGCGKELDGNKSGVPAGWSASSIDKFGLIRLG